MEEKILSKCGYRCDLCLAYQPNVEKADRRQELSDGWFALYGFRIPAEDIYCEGCVSADSPRLIDSQCPVRPCVVERGLEHCGHCKDFVCEKFKQRGVRREFIEEKLGRKVTEKEYLNFIKPYESEERLNAIRKNP